jgi:membrane protein implicated in regulation of membrane protease activity
MSWVIYLYYAAIVLSVILVGLSAMGALGIDMDMDGHPDLESDAHPSILSLLGVGKAPLAILVLSYLLSFGVAGVLFVMLTENWLDGFEGYSLGFSALFSVVSTAALAGVLGRMVPTVESYAKKYDQLVGREGVVITRITPTSGSADVRDSGGSLHRIPAVTISGEISRGEKILVVSYDYDDSTFVVEQLPS